MRLPVFPDSPVGRQAAWLYGHWAERGAGLTVDEIAAHMHLERGQWTPEIELERQTNPDVSRPPPESVGEVREESPYSLSVIEDYGDEKPWKVTFHVEEAPPHRITGIAAARHIPEDVVIREAVDDDGPALNELEVRAPMQLGGSTLTYDRGDDFLGFARLMENNHSWVAERAGRLLGFAGGAMHPVRIGGRVYDVMLLHHVRVPVEARGGGIFSAVNQRVFGAHPTQQGAYGYTALDNAEGMALGGPGAWTFGVFRAVLDCADLAGPPTGRRATPDDAARIVEIINGCHDREEVFVPYSPESFSARMQRAPRLYSWGDVLLDGEAVVGVWPAHLRVSLETHGRRTEAVRATVLDYGFLPGADGAFEQLLRAWCGRLVEEGHTELSLILSEGSPGFGIASRLAKKMEPFAFRMSVPEPPGAKERGLYVDAIYF
jgi:hypothetical protein